MDDELYLQILSQNPFNVENFATDITNRYELFIKNIFDQPLESAFRRSRVFYAKRYEDYLIDIKQIKTSPIKSSIYRKLLAFGNSVKKTKNIIIFSLKNRIKSIIRI